MAIAPSPSLLLLCMYRLPFSMWLRCTGRLACWWSARRVDDIFRRMYPYAIEQRNHVQFASLGRLYSTYSFLYVHIV